MQAAISSETKRVMIVRSSWRLIYNVARSQRAGGARRTTTARPSDTHALSHCRRADGLAQSLFGHDLDPPPQQTLQLELEARQVEEGSAGLKRDQKIDVGVRPWSRPGRALSRGSRE